MDVLRTEALAVGRAMLALRANIALSNGELSELSSIGRAAIEQALIVDPLQPPHPSSSLAGQNPFAADLELLGTSLSSLLTHDLRAEVEADVRRVFALPGKLLSQERADARGELDMPKGIWALICLNVARYCRPDAERTLLTRIALVCDTLFAALDCLDEVEDQDNTPLRNELGDARTSNLSTVLIALSHNWLLARDVPGLSDRLTRNLLALLHRRLLLSAEGQHMDILLESVEQVAPEVSLDMTRAKTGSLGGLMCQFSALAVRASRLAEDFARLGEHMGLALQMQDDIYDYMAGNAAPLTAMKSDVRRRKKSLPAVFAAQQLVYLQTSMHRGSNEREMDVLRPRAIEDAVRATWGMAYYFRRQALLVARQIEEKRSVPFPPVLLFLCGLDGVT